MQNQALNRTATLANMPSVTEQVLKSVRNVNTLKDVLEHQRGHWEDLQSQTSELSEFVLFCNVSLQKGHHPFLNSHGEHKALIGVFQNPQKHVKYYKRA